MQINFFCRVRPLLCNGQPVAKKLICGVGEFGELRSHIFGGFAAPRGARGLFWLGDEEEGKGKIRELSVLISLAASPPRAARGWFWLG
ncbi:MAG: hypothetical protein V1889_01380 [archaeon]